MNLTTRRSAPEAYIFTIARHVAQQHILQAAAAAINVPLIPEKLAARAVVGYQDSGGWIVGPLGNDVNASELRSYRLKITEKPTDALSIKLSAMDTTNDYGAASWTTSAPHASCLPAGFSL